MWCSFNTEGVCNKQAPPAVFEGIKAPVGALENRRGATGNSLEDIKTVQKLLNGVATKEGGAEGKLNIDGRCGPRTKSAIKVFQLKQFPDKQADSIVDPNGRTLYRLNVLCHPENDGRLLELARDAIPSTASYVTSAIMQLELVRVQMLASRPSLFSNERIRKILNENFHLDRSKNQIRDIGLILKVYYDMRMLLAYQPHGPNLKPAFGFMDHMPSSDAGGKVPYAYAFLGGYHFRKGGTGKPKDGPDQATDRIYFTRRVLSAAKGIFEYATIHELAHFVGGRWGDIDCIDDRAYHHRDKTKFGTLSTHESITNADCYSQFAWMLRHDTHFHP